MRSIAIHPETRSLAATAAAAIEDKMGRDVVLLDMSTLLGITDVFVIASGSTHRQVRTLADEVVKRIGESDGRRPLRREGVDDAQWVLLDYGDVVVHVFDDEHRAYYDLEHLWADAPRLEWEPLAPPA